MSQEDPRTEDSPRPEGQEGQAPEVDDATVEYAPSHFVEQAEVLAALAVLAARLPEDGAAVVRDPEALRAAASVETVLGRYQEFPQLLAGHLEHLLQPLLDLLIPRLPEPSAEDPPEEATAGVRAVLGQTFDEYDSDAERTVVHTVCHLIYVVAKVAGYKACTAFFPHAVKHVEPVFYCLRRWQLRGELHREWEVRYSLLLWLSNLILVPFALQTFDSTADASLAGHLLRCAVEFLGDSTKCRDAAALLTARMLTRPDAAHRRTAFVGLAAEELRLMREAGASHTRAGGVLLALAITFKVGKREELVGHAVELVPLIAQMALESPDAFVCKTAVKTIQRLGLACLPQRPQSWRYRKACSDVERNLGGLHSDLNQEEQQQAGAVVEDKAGEEAGDVEAELPVPLPLEDVLDTLLRGLAHQDTVVRYSSAKGIGRISERLPRGAADEVLDAVLHLFDTFEHDAAWHGGCLALAEMCRRFVLLPARFSSVVPILRRALAYDVSRGSYSVGSHVRDAACYVCWSVARAYDASHLAPYVDGVSSGLVVAAVTDREVNVRRAASAAFQECVGRLGSFPHGIALVQLMDFFALASLRNAYGPVAEGVGQFPEYRGALLEHLRSAKLRHWDIAVRSAAAATIGALAAVSDQGAVQGQLVPQLLEGVVSPATAVRHGCISAIAALVRALPADAWPEGRPAELLDVLQRLEAKRLYRGRGGEFVRQACCALLEELAAKRLPLPEFVVTATVSGASKKARVHTKVQEFLEDTWSQPLEWLQRDAARAFAAYGRAYYVSFSGPFHGKLVRRVVAATTSAVPNERRGAVLALGRLSPAVLRGTLPPLEEGHVGATGTVFMAALRAVIAATVPEEDPEAQDVETRRNAVESVAALMAAQTATCGVESLDAAVEPNTAAVALAVGALLSSLDDYAVDRRGDVGNFVRVAAVEAVRRVVVHTVGPACPLTAAQAARCVAGMAKQAVEKIDRTRDVCARHIVALLGEVDRPALAACLSADPGAAAAVAAVEAAFLPGGAPATEDWADATATYPALVPVLLAEPELRDAVVAGLCTAVGGKTAHVMKPALEAVAAYAGPESQRGGLAVSLLAVAAQHQGSSRLAVPVFCTMERLFDRGLLPAVAVREAAALLSKNCTAFSKDIAQLLALVPVLACFCRCVDPAAPDVALAARHAAWKQMLVLLASRFPKVRRVAGVEFYTALLALPDGTPGDVASAAQHLMATEWDGTNATAVRTARDALYPMLGVTKPTAAAAAPVVAAPRAQADHSAYKSLVKEMGY